MTTEPLRAPGDVLVHLRRARDLVDREFAEPLDLDRLATTAGLSKYHFLRLFKATYGLTPAAYLSERRIERAQDLLRATNLTVTEVCHAVGFTSLGLVQHPVPRPGRGQPARVPGPVRRRRPARARLLRLLVGPRRAVRNRGEAGPAPPS